MGGCISLRSRVWHPGMKLLVQVVPKSFLTVPRLWHACVLALDVGIQFQRWGRPGSPCRSSCLLRKFVYASWELNTQTPTAQLAIELTACRHPHHHVRRHPHPPHRQNHPPIVVTRTPPPPPPPHIRQYAKDQILPSSSCSSTAVSFMLDVSEREHIPALQGPSPLAAPT